MVTATDNLTGIPLFNSVIERKQAELLLTTQQKLSNVNSSNIPSLEQRLRTVNTELNPTGSGGISDLPSIEERLRNFNQEQKPVVTGFLSEKSQQSGLEYLANIPGSLISGFGQLDNAILSAPNAIIDILDNTGVTKQSNQFIRTNYPQFAKSLQSAGQAGRTVAHGLDALGNVIQEGTDYFSNSAETEALHKKVSAAYDDNSGAVDVAIAMATTVTSNPEAIPEIVAQSLPIMIALAKQGSIFAATFTGMTGQRIDDATEVYQQTHNGQLPEGNDFNVIAIGAVIATAIETLESRFLLSKSARVQIGTKAKESLIGKVAGVPGVNTAVRTVEGAGAEAFQEGSAEFITQLTGQGDISLDAVSSDAVIKPAAINAAIGAGPGGAIKGGVQILPDTGKTLKTGVQTVSAGVEKLVEINTESRIKKAQDSGDNLEIVRIGLEKDISRLSSEEERNQFLVFLAKKLAEADDQLEKMPIGKEREAFNNEIDNLSNKLNTVISASQNLSKREQNIPTTLAAEQALNTRGITAEDEIKALRNIVSDLQEGAEIQERTIENIKGSNFFDQLSEDEKKTVDLVDQVIKTEKEARADTSTKLLEDVAKDIEFGNPKERFIGVKQHRANVSNSIQLGDKAKANKSLKQLVALRQAILNKLKNPSIDKKTGKQFGSGQHAPSFVKQLSSEIEAITATLNLLNANVTAAFGETPLTAKEQATPTIQLFGAPAAKKPTIDKKKSTKKETTTTTTEPVQEEVIETQEPVITPESEIDTKTNIENTTIPKKTVYTQKVLQEKIKKGSFISTKIYKTAIVEVDNILRSIKDIMRECNV